MSVKIMGLVWDLKKSEINREEKYVLLAYADHADHKGANIFPAVSTIAEKTGYSERSVQSITRSIETKGFMVEDGRGPQGTNRWRIPLDRGGARIAPVQKLQGAKDTGTGGAIATAPESSGNRPNDNERFGEIIKMYEENIGPLIPLIAEKLGDEFDTYYNEPDGPNWLPWAIDIAVQNNALNFNYLKKCLSNRKKHGKDWKPSKANWNGHKPEGIKSQKPTLPPEEDDPERKVLSHEIVSSWRPNV